MDSKPSSAKAQEFLELEHPQPESPLELSRFRAQRVLRIWFRKHYRLPGVRWIEHARRPGAEEVRDALRGRFGSDYDLIPPDLVRFFEDEIYWRKFSMRYRRRQSNRAKMRGASRRQKREPEMLRAARMFEDGVPKKAIARSLGVKPPTIRRWLNDELQLQLHQEALAAASHLQNKSPVKGGRLPIKASVFLGSGGTALESGRRGEAPEPQPAGAPGQQRADGAPGPKNDDNVKGELANVPLVKPYTPLERAILAECRRLRELEAGEMDRERRERYGQETPAIAF